MNTLDRYLSSRWDPQNYDHDMEARARREGLVELPNDIEGVPTKLLLRTLVRLGELKCWDREVALDTYVYED